MTKLEELIAKLCPDGVEYKTIRDICKNIVSGGTPTASKSEYYNGDIPWLRTQEVDWKDILDTEIKISELGYNNSSTKWIPKNCVIVAMYGATAAKVAINKIPLTTNQACCNLEIDERIAEYKYVYYWLCKEYIDLKNLGQGSQHNINANIIKNYKLPVPPLEVQREIVHILDDYAAVTTELQQKLQEELAARQKQYEYYKTKLFLDAQRCQNVTLDKISKNKDSQRKPVTSSKRESGNIPYYGASGIVDYVKDFIFDGDYLLVSEDGANLLARSTPIAFSIHGKTWVNNHAHILEFDNYYTRKYVEFYLNSIDLSAYVTGGAQPKLNQKNLNSIKIPLPPFEVQQRIVSILDRFDKLCNDITSGLPAEISLRKKQYEHYRDKLLTFKELKKEA